MAQRFPWVLASPRTVYGLIHLMARLTRPLTLGVRAVIIDPAGRVLLVRHSYVPGWHFPGGGVEPGETLRDALERESREEAGIEILGEPVLHGVFFNRKMSRRDHVAVYVVRNWRQAEASAGDWEIAETAFFDPAALPEAATAATRARLGEVLAGHAVAVDW